MATTHYLTVPDFLWIQLQVTKAPGTFGYAKLEEAVFHQYAYGQSADVPAQAARLLAGFVRDHPFPNANRAVGFLGTLAFLAVNGYEVKLADSKAAAWAEELWANPGTAKESIAKVVKQGHAHLQYGVPDARAAVTELLAAFPKTVASLLATEPAAALS